MEMEQNNAIEEEALKILNGLDSQTIDDLRKFADSQLSSIISSLDESSKYFYSKIGYDKLRELTKKDEKKRKKNFWLAQLGRFLAVAIFRIPIEATPVIEYPSHDDKKTTLLNNLVDAGEKYYNSIQYFRNCFDKIKRTIDVDDLKLIVFLNSIVNGNYHYADFSLIPFPEATRNRFINELNTVYKIFYESNIPIDLVHFCGIGLLYDDLKILKREVSSKFSPLLEESNHEN